MGGRSFISIGTFDAFLERRAPLVYVISDRRLVPVAWEEWVRELVRVGVDCLQVREGDLSDSVLYQLVQETVEACGNKTAVLVNRRADVAAAAGAAGVHLPAAGLRSSDIRRAFSDRLWIGFSAHNPGELRRHPEADYALLGPVVAPLSKGSERAPLGFAALHSAPLPALALGGISVANAQLALRAGACGVAGITLGVERTAELVALVKGYARQH